MRIVETHGSICDKLLTLNEIKHTGCSSEFKVLCSACSYSSTWISSPELPDRRDLVNIRLTYAYLSSGLLPSQLERFLKAAKLDTLPLNRMTSDVKQYTECVKEERNASCAAALQNERAKSGNNGIDIITDERHTRIPAETPSTLTLCA